MPSVPENPAWVQRMLWLLSWVQQESGTTLRQIPASDYQPPKAIPALPSMPLHAFRELNWQKTPLVLAGDWGKNTAEPGPGSENEAEAGKDHHRHLQWVLAFNQL